jgi:CO/xanthine dehydrogenase Mo-binding subunit
MCSKDGKITGLRVDAIADHGAFDSTAQPTKFPAGFFHIVCGSYDLQASHVKVKAVYTNKAWPTGARSASPRPCTSSSGWSTRWRSR